MTSGRRQEHPRPPGTVDVGRGPEPAAPGTPPTVPIPADGVSNEQFVRPFIVTGGRTRPADDRLRVETLVTAIPAALSAPLNFERRRIVEVCQWPLSVAEIAAGLGVPLGVVRVLIADLLAERYLTVHEHVGQNGHLSLSLLERIRDGVRAL
ncbi:DUF742 domain-containing protein [Actinocorallia longicatena]|uniref:DUF742 domain-containing protein n=1 Tax=Actinocorallia longicatena TaxID=111803 RepID=A0ABP6Q4E8_9ACTN